MERMGNTMEKNEMYRMLECMQENLSDVANVIQLLEISLQANEDDLHIIQNVHLIGKMVSVVSEQCNALFSMDSDCGSSLQ